MQTTSDSLAPAAQDAQTAHETERLTRQAPLRLSIPQSVAVIGIGGVGSWIAYFLALAGVPRIQMWDADEVSETNLNRLPFGEGYLNQSKSLAMQNFLERIISTCDTTALFTWTQGAANELEPPEWVIAATDTWASRCAIAEWCRAHSVKYIEASADGEFGGCTGEPATFITPEEELAGYASVPVHVGPCVMAAAACAYYVLHGTPPVDTSWRFGWSTITSTTPEQSRSGLVAQLNDQALAG